MRSREPSEHAAAFLLGVSLQTVQMRRQVVPARMSLWELAHAATTSAVPSPKDAATRNRPRGSLTRLPWVGHAELGHIAPYLKPHVHYHCRPCPDAASATRTQLRIIASICAIHDTVLCQGSSFLLYFFSNACICPCETFALGASSCMLTLISSHQASCPAETYRG